MLDEVLATGRSGSLRPSGPAYQGNCCLSGERRRQHKLLARVLVPLSLRQLTGNRAPPRSRRCPAPRPATHHRGLLRPRNPPPPGASHQDAPTAKSPRRHRSPRRGGPTDSHPARPAPTGSRLRRTSHPGTHHRSPPFPRSSPQQHGPVGALHHAVDPHVATAPECVVPQIPPSTVQRHDVPGPTLPRVPWPPPKSTVPRKPPRKQQRPVTPLDQRGDADPVGPPEGPVLLVAISFVQRHDVAVLGRRPRARIPRSPPKSALPEKTPANRSVPPVRFMDGIPQTRPSPPKVTSHR